MTGAPVILVNRRAPLLALLSPAADARARPDGGGRVRRLRRDDSRLTGIGGRVDITAVSGERGGRDAGGDPGLDPERAGGLPCLD